MPSHPISTELDQPILFRTVRDDVYESTLYSGSIWLRSDAYYRAIEDRARVDAGEGITSGTPAVPLQFALPAALGAQGENLPPPVLNVSGSGKIGQQIVPHYILSLHGSSISEKQRLEFGGNTIGVRSPVELMQELLLKANRLCPIARWQWGQVQYQWAAFMRTRTPVGSFPIGAGDVAVGPASTNVLSKAPVLPFIEQDEWRMVLFVDRYFENDPMAPLKLNVEVTNFYPYLRGAQFPGG